MKNQIILSRLPLTTAPESTVQIFNLSDALAEFRAQLERDAGQPVSGIEINAALILDDLCAFLGFGSTQHSKILGQEAAAFVEQFREAR